MPQPNERHAITAPENFLTPRWTVLRMELSCKGIIRGGQRPPSDARPLSAPIRVRQTYMVKVVIAVVAVLAIVAVLLSRTRAAPVLASMPQVRLGDVSRVFQLVSSTQRDGTFGVLLFGERGQPPAEMDALNVQFSVENGRVGLDWVLLAPRNVEARDRVVAFFERSGSASTSRSMNGVNYLRTENGDLANLAVTMLRSVFGVTDTQEMPLIAEGFSWAVE